MDIKKFGLREGQIKYQGRFHNAGWYDKDGVKVGRGDLTHEDLVRIHTNLDDNEVFVILSEGDSFWKFVEDVGVIGGLCTTSPDEKTPGKEYIAIRCRMAITNKGIFVPMIHNNDVGEIKNVDGVTWFDTPRKGFFALLGIKIRPEIKEYFEWKSLAY